MQNVSEILTGMASLSAESREWLDQAVVKNVYAKGSLLLEQGNICRHLYLLRSGFARGYFNQKGKEMTSWFALDHDIVTSMYSFITQKASLESIEVLEESVVDSISFTQLQELYRKFPEFNVIGRLLTERYYIELEEHTLSLQYQSAKERYLYLLERQPQVLQRASLGHIASYLGITAETLSRIRKKI